MDLSDHIQSLFVQTDREAHGVAKLKGVSCRSPKHPSHLFMLTSQFINYVENVELYAAIRVYRGIIEQLRVK